MNRKWVLFFFLSNVCSIAQSSLLECQQLFGEAQWQSTVDVCENQINSEAYEPASLEVIETYRLLYQAYSKLDNPQKKADYLQAIRTHPLFKSESRFEYEWERWSGKNKFFAGKIQDASTHFNRALSLAIDSNNLLWMSISYNDVGAVANKNGHFKKAMNQYNLSLALKKELGDHLETGKTLFNIAIVYKGTEKYEVAIDFFFQAIRYYDLMKIDNTEASIILANQKIKHVRQELTDVMMKLGHSEEAKEQISLLFESYDQRQSDFEKTKAYITVGKFYFENKEYSLANTFLKNAYELQKNKEFDLSSKINFELAQTYHILKEDTLATKVINELLNSTQIDDEYSSLAASYLLLSDIYASSDLSKSFSYFKKSSLFKEKFLEQKHDQDLKTIQHETEKDQIKQQLLQEKVLTYEEQEKNQKLLLSVVLVTFLMLLFLAYLYHFRRVKQKEAKQLLKTIEFHQNQLVLLKTDQAIESHKDPKLKFREQLVKTMVEAINTWEQSTGKTRVDLAEESKFWTITIDNGCLRTRSLDKYLQIETIPRNPRWRVVVQTCHYILADLNVAAPQRELLTQELDQTMSMLKELALKV